MGSLNAKRGWAELLAVGVGWAQGLYFFVLGLWPLADIRSFQLVTGEKTDHLVTGLEADHWLVATVAALIVVIGVVLLVAAWRRRISTEIVLLGIASAAVLAAIDIVYTTRQTISQIYLADAACEIAFIVAWIASTLGRER